MTRSTLLFLALLSLLLLRYNSNAQNLNLDSLKTIIATSQIDTTLIKAKLDYAYELIDKNPDTSLSYTESALDFAIKINYHYGIGKGYNMLGLINDNNSKYNEALKNYAKALEVRTKIYDLKGIANTYQNLGITYFNLSSSDSALKYLTKSLSMLEKQNDKSGIANVYQIIGVVYAEQAYYEKAIENYIKAGKLFDELGDNEGLARIKNGIGILYGKEGKHSNALPFFLSVNTYFEIQENVRATATSCLNLGYTYGGLDSNKNALHYFSKALILFQSLGDNAGVADSYYGIGYNNYHMKDISADAILQNQRYNTAIENFLKAQKIYEELSDKVGVGDCYNKIGGIYIEQSKFTEAENCLTKALAIEIEIQNIDNLNNVYANLHWLYDSNGNHKLARKYKRKHHRSAKQLYKRKRKN